MNQFAVKGTITAVATKTSARGREYVVLGITPDGEEKEIAGFAMFDGSYAIGMRGTMVGKISSYNGFVKVDGTEWLPEEVPAEPLFEQERKEDEYF